jgi:hypothetical protein
MVLLDGGSNPVETSTGAGSSAPGDGVMAVMASITPSGDGEMPKARLPRERELSIPGAEFLDALLSDAGYGVNAADQVWLPVVQLY